MMRIKISFSLFLLFTSSCISSNYKQTLSKASEKWSEHNIPAACLEIRKIDASDLPDWKKQDAYEFIKIATYCDLTELGRNNLKNSLKEPFRSYSEGLEYMLPGNGMGKPIKIFKKMIKKYPEEFEFKYRLALLYVMSEEFNKALQLLNNKKIPRYRYVHTKMLVAKCYLGTGKPDKVSEVLAPLVEFKNISYSDVKKCENLIFQAQKYRYLLPDKVKKVVKNAKHAIERKNAAKALDMLADSLEEYPELSVLHYLRGVIHLYLGNRPEAIMELEKAVKLNPSEFMANFLLGRLYVIFNKKNTAEKHLKEAVKWNPFLTGARKMLENLCIKKGDFDTALKLHLSIMNISKPSMKVPMRRELASLQEKAGKLHEALDTYKEIIKEEGHENGFFALLAAAKIHMILSEKELGKTVYHRKQAKKYLKYAESIKPTSQELKALRNRLDGKKTGYTGKHVKISGARRVTEDPNLF